MNEHVKALVRSIGGGAIFTGVVGLAFALNPIPCFLLIGVGAVVVIIAKEKDE